MKRIFILCVLFVLGMAAWSYSFPPMPPSTADLTSPGAIGGTSPSTGAFTTLSTTGAITNTLAEGSAPFVITSNTVSTNLNADLLDGESASAFQDADAGLSSLAALDVTDGDIIYATGSDAYAKLDNGTANYLLQANGANAPSWMNPSAFQDAHALLDSLSGLTLTVGDIIYSVTSTTFGVLDAGDDGTLLMGNGAGAPSFLAAGTSGYFLIAAGSSADPVWTNQPTLASLEGLAIANGSIIYGTGTDALAVLAPSDTQFLRSNGAGAPSWETAPAATATLVSLEAITLTVGDIIYATGGDALTQLDHGTAGYLLQANGEGAPSWVTNLSVTTVTTASTVGGVGPAVRGHDKDADGTEKADEDAGAVGWQMTATAEDNEVSDWWATHFGGATAGTEYRHAWFDASAQLSCFGIMTQADAPGDVAGYESMCYDWDLPTDGWIGVSSPISSSVGFDFGAMSLITTGTIQAGTNVIANAGATIAVTPAQMNSIILQTVAGEVELPDVCDSATMQWLLVFVRDANETVEIAVADGGDTIVYPGETLGADDELDSPGGADDAGTWVSLICMETDKWYVIGNRGTWTDGGPADD